MWLTYLGLGSNVGLVHLLRLLYGALRKNSLQLWRLSLINSSNGYDWCRVWVLLYQGTVTLSGSPFVFTLSIGALFDRVSQY